MNPSESGTLSTQKPNVFISHSHKDQIYARKILVWLEKVGFTPWASFEECSDLYRIEIDNALLECDIFLLIASKDSLASVEVRREITTAGSQNKKIAYYKLDESSHSRAGFLTLLSEKQYVQASRNNLELDKLALILYETWDGNKDALINQIRDSLISICLATENENYLKWREKLWSLRLDSSNNTRKLSSFDRAMLEQKANSLGIIVSIDDENQAFSLNKLSFFNEIRGIVAKRRIDKAMLTQIEKKRIECSVSRDLAVSILSNRLSKIDYLNHIIMSRSAEKTDHWLVARIRTMQGKEPINFSSESTNTSKNGNLSYVRGKESDCFTFEHSICPLEINVAGAVDTKMSLISLVRNGQRLTFSGLQGLRPFSCQASDPVTEISVGTDLIRLLQKGYKSYIVIRVSNSSDLEALLAFLKQFAIQVEHTDSMGMQDKNRMQAQSASNQEDSGHESDKPNAGSGDSGEALVWISLGIVLFIWMFGVGLRSLGSLLFHRG